MKTTLVTTIVNGVNKHGIGAIVDLLCVILIRSRLSLQPVLTGRDEDIDDETCYAQRHTLSQMTEDLRAQLVRLGSDARLVSSIFV
jgi:hypothetical protein